MTIARVLFVDDEVEVLEGLADMLRRDHKRWEIAFAVGGPAALAELAKRPFDIIVSDMRMPGMDGAQLLGRVKIEFPGVTRLVLSGHADRDALLRAIPVAHQFLSKPCDAAVLRGAIERAHSLRALLDEPAIRSVVGRITQLPSVPRLFLELNALAADASKGLAEIARAIEVDPAMCVRILQVVASPYFNLRREVRSVQEAIGMLGLELVRGLVASASACAAASAVSIRGFSIERQQRAALACAGLARRMATDPRRADEAFTAALLHDVGKVVLALGMPREVEQILASSDPRPGFEQERDVFGVSHAEVGAYLLGIWGLPYAIVEAAAYHHAPSQVRQGDRELLAIVHAADALCDVAAEGGTGRLDVKFVEDAGLGHELPRWNALAAEVALHRTQEDRR